MAHIERVWLKTCKKCGYDNPDDSSTCNGCQKSLSQGIFGVGHYRRWACRDCGTINAEANCTCAGCHKKACSGIGISDIIIWSFIIFLVYIFMKGQ